MENLSKLRFTRQIPTTSVHASTDQEDNLRNKPLDFFPQNAIFGSALKGTTCNPVFAKGSLNREEVNKMVKKEVIKRRGRTVMLLRESTSYPGVLALTHGTFNQETFNLYTSSGLLGLNKAGKWERITPEDYYTKELIKVSANTTVRLDEIVALVNDFEGRDVFCLEDFIIPESNNDTKNDLPPGDEHYVGFYEVEETIRSADTCNPVFAKDSLNREDANKMVIREVVNRMGRAVMLLRESTSYPGVLALTRGTVNQETFNLYTSSGLLGLNKAGKWERITPEDYYTKELIKVGANTTIRLEEIVALVNDFEGRDVFCLEDFIIPESNNDAKNGLLPGDEHYVGFYEVEETITLALNY